MIREIFSKWPFAKINTREMQFFSTHENKYTRKFVRLRYDQPQNESFCKKLESFQHNAALAITGAM